MNRLAQLTALTILLTGTLTGCESLIGNLTVNLGGEPFAENNTTTSAESAENCIQYHPMPDSIKKYAVEHRRTDPQIDPWAGWLLSLRSWLEGGC